VHQVGQLPMIRYNTLFTATTFSCGHWQTGCNGKRR